MGKLISLAKTLTISFALASIAANAGETGPVAPTSATTNTVLQNDEAADTDFDALVVLVFDDACGKWCNQVKPMMKELKAQYGRVRFLELNASSTALSAAKQTAKAWHIENFLAATTDNIPEVGVFEHKPGASKPKLVKELVGLKSKEVYAAAVEHALTKK